MSHATYETNLSCAAERFGLVERLKSHDIIPTHQRLVIAQALFSRRQHVSADQLLSQVNLDHAEVSKATIYNTLNLFEEKGLVRRIVVDPERIFYDTHLESHPHLFNVEAGELTDIEAPDLRVEGLPPLPPGLYQEGLDIVIRVRSTPRSAEVAQDPANNALGKGNTTFSGIPSISSTAPAPNSLNRSTTS